MNDRGRERLTSSVAVSLQLEGTEVIFRCVLVSIGNGQVHLQGEQIVSPSSSVELKLGRISLSGEVSYCKPKGEQYLICVAVAPESARQGREPRFPMKLRGKVISLGGSGTSVLPGTITDVSRSGVGLKVSGELAVGSTVCIETETMLIVGEIRHCRKEQEGLFAAGLEISDVFTSDTGRAVATGNAVARVNRLLRRTIRHIRDPG